MSVKKLFVSLIVPCIMCFVLTLLWISQPWAEVGAESINSPEKATEITEINEINEVTEVTEVEEVVEEQEIEFDFEEEAALLMEADTGKMLFESNSDARLYPASLTKIMTALLVMEALEQKEIHFGDEVYISRRAASMGGSQLFLSEGDQVSLKDLFTGLMVASANDAAVALAEHISGSVEAFADAMNNKARQLGMTNSNFVNPNGLHHEDHYSSAYDISIMSRELLEYPQIHDFVTIWMDENFLEGEIQAGEVFLSNTNRMVRFYRGCDGLKTGFTDEAGNCIAATAKRGDTRYLAIVLNVPSADERYEAARTLLDYGFSRYKSVPVIRKGETITVLPVDRGDKTHISIRARDNLTLVTPLNEDIDYQKEIKLPEQMEAPLMNNQVVGEIVAEYAGETKSVELVAAGEVSRASYFQITSRLLKEWLR